MDEENGDDDNLPLVGLENDDDHDSDDEDTVTEDADSRKEQSNVSVTFDTTLPVSHTYLGGDLEEVHGRTLLVDDLIIDLPLFPLQNVVLFPDQTLPLHLFQQAMVNMMRHVLTKDRTFGMVNLSGMKCSEYGTTAEVVAYREESDPMIGLSTLRLKAVGRQRFQLVSMRRQIDGILIGKIRILPEAKMGDPLKELRFLTHPKQNTVPTKAFSTSLLAYDSTGNIVAVTRNDAKLYHRYFCSAYTQWPAWVYEQYDVDLLMSKIRRELGGWNQSLDISSLPTDPTLFSFWIASNLPLVDEMKLNLLSISNPVHRLRMELDIMTKCTILCCRHCRTEITRKEHVFSLSIVGPLGTYVNPNGHVHETLTVCHISNIALRGRSSTEHSWFPGYAWTIMECRTCGQHMGWKFTAPNKQLQPQKFWGVCRASIIPSITKGNLDDGESISSESSSSYIAATSSLSSTESTH